MELTYIKQGDYLLPDLFLEDKPKQNISKYGILRLNYLRQHRKALYSLLLAEDNLA